jgi:ketosteroid isomerase-like protein
MRPARIARSVVVAVGLVSALALAAGRPIERLIEAERAFSALSVAQGMRPAFLAYLADDGVIFRPGPINGAQSWHARKDVPGVLEWAPEFVELSGAGDLGFSTGPWVYRASAGAKEADQGHFISVWRRSAQGAWKVVLDCGTSHGPPEHGPRDVTVSEGPAHAPPDSNAWKTRGFDAGASVGRGGTRIGAGTGGVSVSSNGLGLGLGIVNNGVRSRADYEYRRTAHEKNRLMTAERALAWHARKSGWERAFREVSAGDLRTNFEGALPTLGPDAAAAAFATTPRGATREYRGNGISRSWDLGYAYGLAIARPPGAARTDTSAFAHLWRKDEADQWRLAIAWEGPFPSRGSFRQKP